MCSISLPYFRLKTLFLQLFNREHDDAHVVVLRALRDLTVNRPSRDALRRILGFTSYRPLISQFTIRLYRVKSSVGVDDSDPVAVVSRADSGAVFVHVDFTSFRHKTDKNEMCELVALRAKLNRPVVSLYLRTRHQQLEVFLRHEALEVLFVKKLLFSR